MKVDSDRAVGGSLSGRLSSFASYVYSWVAFACGITAVSAYLFYSSGLFIKALPFWWAFALSTFALTLFIRYNINKMSSSTLSMYLVAYAALEGMFFGTVLPLFVYSGSGSVIWTAFACAGAMFVSAVLYGTYTKTDLTSIGQVSIFALFGLCAVSFVMVIASFFWSLTFMHVLMSYAGVVIFLGLSAFESQKINRLSRHISLNDDESHKMALITALGMYVNLITLFWYTLRILSSDRSRSR